MSTKYELKDGAILREGAKIATRDSTTGTIDYLPDMDRYRAPVSAWLKEIGMDKPPVTPPEVALRQASVVRFEGKSLDPVAGQLPTERLKEVTSVGPEINEKVSFAGTNLETTEQKRARLQAELNALDAGDDLLTPEQRRIKELEAELGRLRTQSAPAPAAGGIQPMSVHPVPVNLQAPGVSVPPGFVIPGHGNAPIDENKLKTYRGAPGYDGHNGDKTPAFVDWLWENHTDDAVRRYSGRKLPGTSYDERLAAARAANKTQF